MKIRNIIFLAGILLPVMAVHAQTDSGHEQYVGDALRFSQTNINGSARFQGMGGVNAALGADVSSVSGNPAGLGFFRKSEWSISPALGFANTNTDYLGNTTKDSRANFNIANLGIVFASPKAEIKGGAWRGGAFGISFSRLNNFQNQFTLNGVNNRTSITDYLAEQTYNLNISDTELQVDENAIGARNSIPSDLYEAGLTNQVALAQLAYAGFLIDAADSDNDGKADPDNDYLSGVGNQFRVNQNETVKTTGAQYQWNFSYGGNISDKFYFGASVGLSRIRYGYEKAFREDVLETDFPRISNFTLTDYYDASGTGINGTVGFIFKPNDIIRFGASATTPTYYRINEEYSTDLVTNFNDRSLSDGLSNISLRTVTLNYGYNLTSPFRASGGVAVFFGKRGFISADAEYLSYNTAKLSRDLSDANTDIRNRYQPTVNVRVGGEFREGIFRLRGGAAYFGDPYDSNYDDLDRTKISFTAGAGIRLSNFYIDFAAVHSRFKSGYTPYPLSNQNFEPSATIRNAYTNAVISFGTFF